jgi:hypothetical protein
MSPSSLGSSDDRASSRFPLFQSWISTRPKSGSTLISQMLRRPSATAEETLDPMTAMSAAAAFVFLVLHPQNLSAWFQVVQREAHTYVEWCFITGCHMDKCMGCDLIGVRGPSPNQPARIVDKP